LSASSDKRRERAAADAPPASHTTDNQQFHDRNPAYNHAYVKATWSGAEVCYPSEHREFSVARKNGVIEIPLQRRRIGDEEPRPEKASANRQ